MFSHLKIILCTSLVSLGQGSWSIYKHEIPLSNSESAHAGDQQFSGRCSSTACPTALQVTCGGRNKSQGLLLPALCSKHDLTLLPSFWITGSSNIRRRCKLKDKKSVEVKLWSWRQKIKIKINNVKMPKLFPFKISLQGWCGLKSHVRFSP